MILLLTLLCEFSSANSITFSKAIENLSQHETIKSLEAKIQQQKSNATLMGAWDDPKIKISAKNLPKDSLKNDKTPMSGYEISLSQKIPLSGKKYHLEEASHSISLKTHHIKNDKLNFLTRELWSQLIIQKKIAKELLILKENYQWISKILEVSKKLYTTGKVTQRSILDIQIRMSEIDTDIFNKRIELSMIGDKLEFLAGARSVEKDTIPWDSLTMNSIAATDSLEQVHIANLKSNESNLAAARQDYIPDLTFALGYTKRSNIDGLGDFLSFSVSAPLPVMGQKSSRKSKSISDRDGARWVLENYRKSKKEKVSLTKKEIQKIQGQLNIINNRTMRFAQSSRDITAKSYSHGNLSYVDLLQSELKLQSIQMSKVMLETELDLKRASLKYLKGESLR